jgi:hypothetical protein
MLLAFHAGGYLILFNIQQNQASEDIKEKILSGIPKENLVLLKIPLKVQSNDPSVFKKIHAKEFRYNGIMYDIVSQKQVGKTTWFYCVKDKKETNLVDHLMKIEQKNNSKNPLEKNKTQTLERLLLSLYEFSNNDMILTENFKTTPKTSYFFSLKLWTKQPHLPPPKV